MDILDWRKADDRRDVDNCFFFFWVSSTRIPASITALVRAAAEAAAAATVAIGETGAVSSKVESRTVATADEDPPDVALVLLLAVVGAVLDECALAALVEDVLRNRQLLCVFNKDDDDSVRRKAVDPDNSFSSRRMEVCRPATIIPRLRFMFMLRCS